MSEYATGKQFESSTGSTQCIYSYDFIADGGPKKREAERISFDKCPQPTEFRS